MAHNRGVPLPVPGLDAALEAVAVKRPVVGLEAEVHQLQLANLLAKRRSQKLRLFTMLMILLHWIHYFPTNLLNHLEKIGIGTLHEL